jgi:hypothetical protein
VSVEEQPEEMTPAERRLLGHLTLLQDAPASPPSLTEHIVRTARWQQTVRSPLLALAHLTAAAADAVRLIFGGGRT